MTIQDAGRVLAILTAAFPDQALEREAAVFWTTEIAELADYEAAMQAVREIARTREKFPPLAAVRDAYASVRRRRAETHGLPEGEPERTPPPDWVSVAMWARLRRQPPPAKAFPQEAEQADGREVMGEAEYEALRAEWASAGSPMFGVALRSVA